MSRLTVERTFKLANRPWLLVTGVLDGGPLNIGDHVIVHAGDLPSARLDERIREWPAARTARKILALMRAAQARENREVAKVVAETVGLDSTTGRAVAGANPVGH